MSEYGDALTARLEAVGLSRNGLARLLGHKGASQVSRWCAGKAMPRQKALDAIERAFAAHGASGGVPEVGQPDIGPQEGNTEATEASPEAYIADGMARIGEILEADRALGIEIEQEAQAQDLLLQMVNALAALDKPGVTEADQVVEIESAAVEGAKVRRVNVWGRTYYEGEEE